VARKLVAYLLAVDRELARNYVGLYKNVWSAGSGQAAIFERSEIVCKNVYGLLVEQAPGHDEDSRVPFLIRRSVAQGTTFYIRFGGTPLDCSAISLVVA
jgi:hypothetical protein